MAKRQIFRPGPDPYRTANLAALRRTLSNAGLNSFARRLGLPVPANLPAKKRLAALVFYGDIAPGIESLRITAGLREDPYLKPIFRELALEVIERLAREPKELLERERAIRLRLPDHIREIAQLRAGGQLRSGEVLRRGGKQEQEEDDACLELRIDKAAIIEARASSRNNQILKAILAIFGLDAIIDIIEEEFQDRTLLDNIIDLLTIGDWVAAAFKLISIVKRLLAKPGLLRKIIKRLGRWGTARLLLGLGGKLIPAVFAGLLIVNWVLIWRDWKERDAEFQARFKELYDESTCPQKDRIFMENLGYVPR
jgi:hypothetical protein